MQKALTTGDTAEAIATELNMLVVDLDSRLHEVGRTMIAGCCVLELQSARKVMPMSGPEMIGISVRPGSERPQRFLNNKVVQSRLKGR